jgi:hypothetical protein
MKTEYIKTAEDRIRDFSKGFGEEIGGFTMTAIHKELNTMFDVGAGIVDLDRIEMFLARVNKVVAHHRHGLPIPKSALTALSNEHIDMEKWLEEQRKALLGVCT